MLFFFCFFLEGKKEEREAVKDFTVIMAVTECITSQLTTSERYSTFCIHGIQTFPDNKNNNQRSLISPTHFQCHIISILQGREGGKEARVSHHTKINGEKLCFPTSLRGD